MATTAEQFLINGLDKAPDNTYSGDLVNPIIVSLPETVRQNIEFEYLNWYLYQGDEKVYELLATNSLSFNINVADVVGNKVENTGRYSIIVDLISTGREGGEGQSEVNEASFELQFTHTFLLAYSFELEKYYFIERGGGVDLVVNTPPIHPSSSI